MNALCTVEQAVATAFEPMDLGPGQMISLSKWAALQ